MGILDRAAHHHANGETFALATVVRTVSVTAAKAGAKALINPDGSIEEGWIGGGCARMAHGFPRVSLSRCKPRRQRRTLI